MPEKEEEVEIGYKNLEKSTYIFGFNLMLHRATEEKPKRLRVGESIYIPNVKAARRNFGPKWERVYDIKEIQDWERENGMLAEQPGKSTGKLTSKSPGRPPGKSTGRSPGRPAKVSDETMQQALNP